jgi:hypothetical protein
MSSAVFRLFYAVLLLLVLLTIGIVIAHRPIIAYFNENEADSVIIQDIPAEALSQDAPVQWVLHDTVRLAAERVWFVAPSFPEDGVAVQIEIASSDNISLYVFESIKRMDPLDKTAYFPECSGITGTHVQRQCFLAAGNVIAVYAGASAVAYQINVSHVPFSNVEIQGR